MRSPFRISVIEELRHPGLQTKVELVGELPSIELSSARVPEDAEVRFDGTVEAQGAQVIVSGSVHAPWVGFCRRCLEPTEGTVEVELREVFEHNPVEDETYPLEDDQVDLAPVFRQALALGLPLAPLCREDCPGPDPESHPVGSPEDDEAAPAQDPRWAALDELRFDSRPE
jgi:uncharacterized protein